MRFPFAAFRRDISAMRILTPMILLAGPAFADCAALEAMARRDAGGAAPLFAPHEATCQTALQTTGEALVCHSEHPFRSETAIALAAEIEAEIAACFDAPARQADTGVNHPDSYVARWFDVGAARIHLSVKDKGALGKTLVFVRAAEGE